MSFTVIFAIYTIRLAFLQLFSFGASTPAAALHHADWRKSSVAQRQHSLVLDTGRGDFVDRSGRPLTGETYMALAFFPVAAGAHAAAETKEQIRQLAGMLGVSYSSLEQYWHQLKAPEFWHGAGSRQPRKLTDSELKQLSALSLDGVQALPYRHRYLPGYYAAQAIGYISQHPERISAQYPLELAAGKRSLKDQIGGAGLERSLDEWLRGLGQTTAMFFTDGQNRPMHGLGIRYFRPDNERYPLQAVTTIDLPLQQQLEKYADQMHLIEGAIVVLDASNADIVAMVSRPSQNPEQLSSSGGLETVNHALKAEPPGSVFKLVTEAAALEAGVASEHETFECNGEYGKYGLSCWKEGGHGKLTLKEGLAQSCNIVFATVAERLSGEQLQRTALALGIGRQVGWSTARPHKLMHHKLRLLPEEEGGTVFRLPDGADNAASQLEEMDGGVMAQSGIGQRDVRMTPLQAANLVVTLLHGGEVLEPRIVSEVRYANGLAMTKLKPKKAPKSGYGQINPATARKLLRGMEAVVDHGTGKSIRDGIWTVAGKSGTAEVERQGAPRNHQWFAGYGPVKHPRYAVAVLSEYRPVNSPNQATRLFRGVMDLLAEHEPL
ncbi:penicillin-binding protein [Paenibacillus protaetiae]|uniref:Penicillin-binding protein n=2 Tax=Paenibacillus protaetiae TaxID=2509456 RepID=A0A4P6EY08_9BACL|nr:penicillin-binding protein [Paenibacillus protaetiae]